MGKGYSKKEMWVLPDDVASPGHANTKGQSCLHLIMLQFAKYLGKTSQKREN